MAENQLPEEQVKSPEVQHESSDVSVRGVLTFGAGMAVVGIILQILLIWMFDWFQAKDAEAKPALRPWAEERQARLPPEPRLEGLETSPTLRAEQQAEAMLQSYGWVDRQKGIVRLPIQDAMQLLLQRQSTRPAVERSREGTP